MLCHLWNVILKPPAGLQGSSVHGAGSVLASTHMDHSFVVLPKQKSHPQGVPPRPRAGAVQSEMTPPGKTMEESFVVLPPAPASVYRSESPNDGSGIHMQSCEGSPNGQLNSNSSGFHSTITILKRTFEIATAQTQVRFMRVLLLCVSVCALFFFGALLVGY